MPRWKATEQILNPSKDGELFDENWMSYDSISQYAPPSPMWNSDRPMRVEDVDVWEVITEMSGLVGVYAAWCPYDEFYIVTAGWRIVAEFSGWNSNGRLEKFLTAHNVPFPKGPDVPVVPHEARIIVVG